MPLVRTIAALKAFGGHLLLSILVALLVAWVIFEIWYPYPYRELAGGLRLFGVVVFVDVVCGPLLTVVIFNPRKSRQELAIDLTLVAFVQLAALGFGLYTIALARPVVVAFEKDRLVAVSAAQIDTVELLKAPVPFRSLSWRGPILIGTRSPIDREEMIHGMDQSLQGVSPSARPAWWIPYDQSLHAIKNRMKPLTILRRSHSSSGQAVIDAAIWKTGKPLSQLHYLPLVTQKSLDEWSAILDSEANIVGYLPMGGF